MTEPAPLHGLVWIVAHRGASWDAPEHTHAAYRGAVDAGADFLEADLWQSRDGALVCIHDETVDRTSDGTGAVAALTTEELGRLDFGSWFNRANPERAQPGFAGARVVLFEEMLEHYADADRGLRFHVETKHAYIPGGEAGQIDPAMEHELIRVLEKHGLVTSDRVLIQSFWPRSLSLISELTDDALDTALLSVGPAPDVLAAGVDVAAPSHEALLANLDYVERMHSQGKEVHTWTVDDPDVMRTLVRAGVDGIFTNRPKVLRELLEEEFPRWATAGRARRATPP